MKKVLKLEEITHTTISGLDRKKTFVIATMSPLEVHGPHLPIGMDFMQAYRLATFAAGIAASRLDGWSFLLLPPVPVASDTVPALGSVGFPPGLVTDVAVRLLAPFAEAGFARLGYASFHGGPRHLCALEDAAERLKKKYGVPTISLMSAALANFVEGDSFMKGLEGVKGCAVTIEQVKADMHAGFVETSIALHLWPWLVDDGWKGLAGSIPKADGGAGSSKRSFIYGSNKKTGVVEGMKKAANTASLLVRAVKFFQSNTYCGYPALSSPEAGRALFDNVSGICAGLLEELATRGMEMDCHSPLWRYKRIFLNSTISRLLDGAG